MLQTKPNNTSTDAPVLDVFARRHQRRILTFVTLGVVLTLAVIASLILGQFYVPPERLPDILAAGRDGAKALGLAANVVWEIRIPRILLGLLVGAAHEG